MLPTTDIGTLVVASFLLGTFEFSILEADFFDATFSLASSIEIWGMVGKIFGHAALGWSKSLEIEVVLIDRGSANQNNIIMKVAYTHTP